jgi:hypothetical protein
MLNFMRQHPSSRFFYDETTQTVARPPRVDSRKQTLKSKRDTPDSGPHVAHSARDPVSYVLPTRPTPWYPVSPKEKRKRKKAIARCPLRSKTIVDSRRNYNQKELAIKKKKKKKVREARLDLPLEAPVRLPPCQPPCRFAPMPPMVAPYLIISHA